LAAERFLSNCDLCGFRIEWFPDFHGCARLSFLRNLSIKLGQFLALYGGWGLFGISLLDSSFVPLPGLNDLLLMHLSAQHPGRALFYALASTLGSVAGAYLIYGLARGGGRFLWRKQPSKSLARAHRWLERNEFVAILTASVLPPPAPFKAFLATAGALRVNAVRFGLALLLGRGLRFGAEAFLGARYGARAEAYLKANSVWVSLVAAVVLVVGTMVYRRLARTPRAEPATDVSGSSSSGPS
jgi:membrane protein YqaA with SNARE-associated domain